MKLYILIICFVLCGVSCTEQNSNSLNQDHKKIEESSRIISLSGNISEILCVLGKEENLVGVDITSTFPASLKNLPNVGHISQLSIEGLASLDPNVVIGFEDDLSQEDMDQLRNLDIQVNLLNKPTSIRDGSKLIEEIGLSTDTEAKAKEVSDNLNLEIEKLSRVAEKKEVLFIYARGLGTLMVAGKGTVQDEMIKGVGCDNAVGHDGFKTLTAESLVDANPDVILMFDSGYASLKESNELMQIPGVAETKAGINNNFITMDGGLLSNIGPRIPEALIQLKKKIEALY